MKRNTILLCTTLLILILLSSCMPGSGKSTPEDPAGFFMGIWHGWIAPISLIAELFNHNIRVYEPNNTGWLYDIGFYISIIAGFGSLSLFRKKKKENY